MLTPLVNVDVNPVLINLSNPSWDTFLILFYLLAVVIYSFFASRERLSVVLGSIYSALAVTMLTPAIKDWLSSVQPGQFFMYQLGIFVVAFLTLYVLFSQNMALRAEGGHSWVHAIILSGFQVGLLMSSILIFLPQDTLNSPVATQFFTSPLPRSVWMLGPVLAMVFMRRKTDK